MPRTGIHKDPADQIIVEAARIYHCPLLTAIARVKNTVITFSPRTISMTEIISAVEARQKLGELLNRVALRQEEIIIQRAGKPLARTSPITNDSHPTGRKLDFRKAAGLGADIWNDVDAAK